MGETLKTVAKFGTQDLMTKDAGQSVLNDSEVFRFSLARVRPRCPLGPPSPLLIVFGRGAV